ncbi:hypothetical protein Lal_00047495 [Lupinus albus]|uniref:Uncharacterized protein n=1 Tax=Lupinus albus TaxID=3870 RepID=A0A6A4QZX3_LUPAL|nr:hypothetical protein Lalb_Chr02g0151861 [Lupinus albus]KAF1878823.1 hypothetical protein Lal_00047495 [Lupinus albus]
MANSHYSKSLLIPCKTFYIVLILVYLLLVSSCTGIRTRVTLRQSESTKLLRRKPQPDFQPRGLVFNFFPKGIPVPPSGPSCRHNAMVDSKPQN